MVCGAQMDVRNLQECSKMSGRSKFNSLINSDEIRKIWKVVLEGAIC